MWQAVGARKERKKERKKERRKEAEVTKTFSRTVLSMA